VPNLAEDFMIHDVVYWSRTGTDSTGRPVYADPIQLKCRWDDVTSQQTNAAGDLYQSRASVIVPQDMKLSDRLKKGLLASLLPGTRPEQQPGSYEIQSWESSDSPDGEDFIKVAYL
jgi:hypothetical protein